jgi:hypothetical protein
LDSDPTHKRLREEVSENHEHIGMRGILSLLVDEVSFDQFEPLVWKQVPQLGGLLAGPRLALVMPLG